MTNSILGLAAVATVAALLGLFAFGSRWRRLGAIGWFAYAGCLFVAVYMVGTRLWQLPAPHLAVAGAAGFASLLVITRWRRAWNPPGQTFVAMLSLTCVAFVATTTIYTFTADMSLPAVVASLLLAMLEAFAFLLLVFGCHEVVDVIARARWERRAVPAPVPDPAPFVSVQVAAHDEPPELVIGSLKTLRDLDYPAYEVIVLDNNTDDDSLWRPVKEYCDEVGFRFVRLVDWPGFKAGALNHGLEICDPRTEIVALVDADFLVEPNFLSETVGHFSEPSVAIVQTAQDFRVEAEQESEYLRRLVLTYKAFDEVTMPSRNERDAIIFAGTMGLLRKSALEAAGGWSEWCVTEDAETSLRILARGHSAVYIERTYGRGVMPLTFAALKKQRFRWCFGGVQLLLRHWRLLLTGRGTADDGAALRLTSGQRYDYLAGGLQWLQGMLTLLFSVLLLTGVVLELVGMRFRLRPLVGVFVAVPLLLLGSGLIKSLWGLRLRLHASWRDAVAVMGIWLSLSWVVALAATQALLGRKVPFLRTPKFNENESIRQAIITTRAETPLALAFGFGAFLSAFTAPREEALFLAALCGWSAIVFAAAPLTALAASRVELTSSILRRRRALEGRPSRTYRRPVAFGFATAVAFALLLITGSSLTDESGSGLNDVFSLPDRGASRSTDDEDEARDESLAGSASGSDAATNDDVDEVTRGSSIADGITSDQPVSSGQSPNPGASAAPAAVPSPAGGPAPAATAAPDPAPQSTARLTPQSSLPVEPEPQSSPTVRPTPRGTPRNGGPANS